MEVRATAIDLHMGVMRMDGGGRAYVLFLNMSLFFNIGPHRYKVSELASSGSESQNLHISPLLN